MNFAHDAAGRVALNSVKYFASTIGYTSTGSATKSPSRICASTASNSFEFSVPSPSASIERHTSSETMAWPFVGKPAACSIRESNSTREMPSD